MTCYRAHRLIDLYIVNDLSLTVKRRKAFEAHLRNCQKCAKKYRKTKWIIGLVKESWPYNEENQAFLKRINQPGQREQVIDECWEDFKCLIPEFTKVKKPGKYLPLFRRISAVAACLVISITLFLVFSIDSKPKITPKSVPQQIALVPKPSVRIELISQNGSILIPANQQIVSTNELKMLIINGKHRMMMNTNTVLAVEPLVKYSNIGCLVKLTSGQIYTHVEHDGNLFIVDTAHGEAVITGTTFDIKTTDTSTTLVVSEGTVRFESGKGTVNVAADQTSEIVGQSAPSIPLLCNTAELTAWATDYKAGPALTKTELNPAPWDLPLSFGEKPIILEEADYNQWIEQKREWFKTNFPWIFELKDALTREGIEVDYPELLIKSGDVWQFACLDVRPARFSVIDPNSLLKTASNYGFDKLWLLENVPAAKAALEKPALSENSFTDLKAFERWLDYLDETKGLTPPTPIYSFQAGKHLANTRSLIWFAVRNGQYDLSDKERVEVLALLQREVTAACNCQNDDMSSTDEQKKPSCDDDTFKTTDEKIVGYIKMMKSIEERIAEYELVK